MNHQIEELSEEGEVLDEAAGRATESNK